MPPKAKPRAKSATKAGTARAPAPKVAQPAALAGEQGKSPAVVPPEPAAGDGPAASPPDVGAGPGGPPTRGATLLERLLASEDAAPAPLPSGNVVLRYSMYNESFPVVEGRITSKEIDELYCLSDVMPGCRIHLSEKSPSERSELVQAGARAWAEAERSSVAAGGGDGEAASEEAFLLQHPEFQFPYLIESPPGTFWGLEVGKEYWVHVEEDEGEFKKSQERARKMFEMTGTPSPQQPQYDAYTQVFRQVMLDAKNEGMAKGLQGDDLSAYVQSKLEEFNRGQG